MTTYTVVPFLRRCSQFSMKTSDVPLQFFLPLCFVLTLSTIFNSALTWNDFRLLASLRVAKGTLRYLWSKMQYIYSTVTELEYLPGPNEAPLHLKPVVQLVDKNPHYGMSADAEWDTLLPSNHATGIHLVESTNSGEQGHFISIYHQISCLNTLRKLRMNPGWADDQKKQNMAHHCLNVLRQAVLCNGDTTLEPSHLEMDSNGKGVAAASGMDVLHVCKNWEGLRTMAENDSFPNSSSSHHHLSSFQSRR